MAALGRILAGTAVTLLTAAAPASAAITHTNVTDPEDQTFRLINAPAAGSVHVEGTSDGTTGDQVHVVCAKGSLTNGLSGDVAVNANGTFALNVPESSIGPPKACELEALPTGITSADPPGSASPSFTGPRVYFAQREVFTENNEPGRPVDAINHSTQKPLAGWGHWQTSSCAVNFGYLTDPVTLEDSHFLFFCNAWLDRTNAGSVNPATRSQLQVDGENSYLPYAADNINTDAAHLPAPTIAGAYDSSNGNISVSSGEPAVKCRTDTSLPTNTTKCDDFVSTGVRVDTAVTNDGLGASADVVQEFVSTDGHAHQLDLLWDNETNHSTSKGGIRFPWQDSTYKSYAEGAGPSAPPPGPGSVLVKNNISATDGTLAGVQGAVTWAAAPTAIVFRQGTTDPGGYSDFELGYHRTVTPGAPVFFGWRFTLGRAPGGVLTAAHQAESAFRPNVAIASPAGGASITKPAVTVAGTSSDGTGEAVRVSVNGHAAVVGAGGAWSVTVPLALGDNALTATATNRYGATAKTTRHVTRKRSAPPFSGARLVGSRTLRLDRRGRVLVRVRCPAGARGSCRGRAALTDEAKAKLGSRAFKVKSGKSAKVRVKLRRAARRRIAKLGGLAAVVTVTSRDGLGRRRTTRASVALIPR